MSGNVSFTAGTITLWMLPEWAGDIESQFEILHFARWIAGATPGAIPRSI